MDADAIKQIVDSIQKPVVIEFDVEHKAVIVPEGTTVVDISKMLPPPNRIKQRVELMTTAAFIEYVNTYKVLHTTTVFAFEAQASYEAVIDYHNYNEDVGPDITRGPLEHTAKYSCPKSDQWLAWTGSSGKLMDQVQFAMFLENNLPDITVPAGAAFLQLALNLQMHKAAEFESEYKLESGQVKFRYNETIKQVTKAGDIEIPQQFKIAIPVFIDGLKFEMTARFRYRVGDGGKLTLGYEIIRSNEVYAAAIKEVSKEISTGITEDVKFYVGHRS